MKIHNLPAKIPDSFRRICNNVLITFIIASVLSTTCEPDEDIGTIQVIESVSEDISASMGGYISTASGVSLYIPPSALSSDTEITIEKLLVTSGMPDEYGVIVIKLNAR